MQERAEYCNRGEAELNSKYSKDSWGFVAIFRGQGSNSRWRIRRDAKGGGFLLSGLTGLLLKAGQGFRYQGWGILGKSSARWSLHPEGSEEPNSSLIRKEVFVSTVFSVSFTKLALSLIHI